LHFTLTHCPPLPPLALIAPHPRLSPVSPCRFRCPPLCVQSPSLLLPLCQVCSSYVWMNVSWFFRVLAGLTAVSYALSSFHGILRSSHFPLIIRHVLHFTHSLRCGTLHPLPLTSFAGFFSCVHIDVPFFVRSSCCVRFALQHHVHNAWCSFRNFSVGIRRPLPAFSLSRLLLASELDYFLRQ
jgi:hypothetical protein